MIKKIINEAMYYKKLDKNTIKCVLCPHECVLQEGNIGICKARVNKNGRLHSLNYSKIASYNIDPIEKKPLYHFYPGKKIFSIGSFGCNLKCSFCQNYSIVHNRPKTIDITSEEVVDVVDKRDESIGIAYTYNEPSVWYEFVYETAIKIQQKGKKNVLVTNGYINPKPLKKLLPYIHAMNIDLKSFTQDFYSKICKGSLDEVLNTIKIANRYCHIEVSTLLIEGLNNDYDEIEELAKWIASVDKQIPLHLNRYFPAYKMKLPPTNVKKIIKNKEIAQKHLDYVYIGNVAGVDKNTYCPECKSLIIDRNNNYKINNLVDFRCKTCGKEIQNLHV